MCFTVPARVIELTDGNFAVVESNNIKTTISLSLVTDVSVNDYVAVHVGFAVMKLDSIEAERILVLLTELSMDSPQH
ncbi:HypC/HybG/HupF family hydrogenase formation chaperone [Azospirillum sp. YIM B02556]|uniref:HypC/HybG/HupF family hydrogenase formation chaperone n=1 Tax=Azospirillum endophyticum TaxID=2800326 RepID=A0ABS1FCR7_9PROT|nr:HypC/HybG/HupF family hydrogenase formation chaperone [Azospirillum endophyticum]MBK1841022.1 HypC/HybG/HupF family hydrogenase formation chaperone [Azospirillum endophyticum]